MLSEQRHRMILKILEEKRSVTVVGTSAVLMLKDYHFSVGFFGANGISRTAGYTTPDANEALVKKTALEQCKKAYMLCDHSKFNIVSSVTFAPIGGGSILTDERKDEFKDAADFEGFWEEKAELLERAVELCVGRLRYGKRKIYCKCPRIPQ